MSEFHVEVVRLGEINKHPNADTLGITSVRGYPVIVRLGEYNPGDLAVYVPVDSVVPPTEQFAFLGEHRRVKAKKLRGVFSMGLLVKAPADVVEGEDVAEKLGIMKYEPAESVDTSPSGEELHEPDRGFMPVYTDIEGLRRYPELLIDNEPVIATEKIHGENFRARYTDGRLYVGSHRNIKRERPDSRWWQAARAAGLEEKLAAHPWATIFGESHGYTGKFTYGTGKRATLRVFDVFDAREGRYMDHAVAVDFVASIGLEWVPILYAGPYSRAKMDELSDGTSTLDGAHCREGVVVRPAAERWDERIGRVILKLHGETFLLKA